MIIIKFNNKRNNWLFILKKVKIKNKVELIENNNKSEPVKKL